MTLHVPADARWRGEFDGLTVTAYPNMVVIDGLDRPLTPAEARRLTMVLAAAADAADEG